MPTTITTIEALDYKMKNYQAVIVALDNKEIHIYKDIFLVDSLKLDEVPTGLKFGSFGREDGALIITTRNGGLTIKLFKRGAKLEEKASAPGPPAAQSQKLNVPKKTKVFVDLTIREREQAKAIHQTFQRDLFLLRLNTAKTYVGMINENLTPIAVNDDELLKLSAQVHGFGPNFVLKVYLQSSVSACIGLSICFQYDSSLYVADPNVIPVPLMVPGIEYNFQSKITALSDKGLAGDVKIVVIKDDRPTPMLAAIVTMPVAEAPL